MDPQKSHQSCIKSVNPLVGFAPCMGLAASVLDEFLYFRCGCLHFYLFLIATAVEHIEQGL